MIHDWGAFFGMCYQNAHPQSIENMIIFDIGVIKKPPIADALRILFYQMWFAVAFLVAQIPPRAFFRWVGDILMVAYKCIFSWTRISPTCEEVPRGVLKTTSLQCYPYYYFWLGRNGFFRLGPKKMLRPQIPQCPILFFFGLQKNLMFHSDDFLETVKNKLASKVVPMPKAGHWMMNTPENSAVVIKEIKEYLKDI